MYDLNNPHPNASPAEPRPAPPMAVSLALAALVPLAVVLATMPDLVPSAGVLTLGYVVGRHKA